MSDAKPGERDVLERAAHIIETYLTDGCNVRLINNRERLIVAGTIHDLTAALRESREEVERLQSCVNDLQSEMYINCVYCGHRYVPDDEVPAVIEKFFELNFKIAVEVRYAADVREIGIAPPRAPDWIKSLVVFASHDGGIMCRQPGPEEKS